MLEPISTAAATAIAKIALDKFVESGAGELGKRLSEGAMAKLMALGSAVWQRIRGSDRATAVLQQAEQGDAGAVQQLGKYLKAQWNNDLEFAEEVRKLADDLHFELTQIEDNSSMTMNISDNGKGWQATAADGGKVYQADSMTFHEGKSED